jgi:flagellar hook-associated protein 3 FlgL
MRVTGNFFTSTMVEQLNLLTARQYRLQQQAATGQRIQMPEDDPAAMQRVLGLRTEDNQLKQFLNNVSVLKDRANISFDALKGIKNVSDRAGEIATLADDTRSADELQAYAAEVTQLIQQAAQLANSKYRDEYLFAGTASGAQPFTVTTDANGNVTAVTYQGNANIPQSEIESGVTLSANVPGQNTTGSGPRGLIADSRTGADFFNHLIALQNDLLAGNTGAIATNDRPALAADEDNLIYHITANGAVQMRLETTESVLSNRSLSMQQLISKEADADLTETLVQLNQTQTAYQAALQSTAAILGTSLLDYVQ